MRHSKHPDCGSVILKALSILVFVTLGFMEAQAATVCQNEETVCGNGGNGKCVNGLCMVEVPMAPGVSGDTVCAAEGLMCDDVPVLSPPSSACLAFHPTASVTTSVNGWREGVHCDTGDSGLACENKTNVCHNCPLCGDNLGCTTSNSSLLNALYAKCVPPPLTLVDLEVIQVVQDLVNSQALYSGKPTLVRAHLSSEVTQSAQLLLRVFNASDEELPFSPLVPDAPGGVLSISANTQSNRKDLATTANFHLPTNALEGNVKLMVIRLGEPLGCSENAGNTPGDCIANVQFLAPKTPELRIIAVDWLDPQSLAIHRLTRNDKLNLINRLISAYPIKQVKWDDRQMFWPSPPVLDNTLVLARRLRALDGCSTADGCNRMYYAAIPKHSLEGVAYLDGYAGTGFVHPDPKAEGRHTHSHEIGHNLNRHHSVIGPPTLPLSNGQKQGPCGSVAGSAKPDFPRVINVPGLPARAGQHVTLRQVLGPLSGSSDEVFGYDSMQKRLVDPRRFFDLMGYCSSPVIDMWPSSYTYGLIASKLDQRYPVTKAARALAVPQDYVLISGTINPDSGAVTLLPLDFITGGQPDSSPDGGWTAELLNGSDSVISSVNFEPEVIHPRGGNQPVISFMAAIQDPGDGVKVKIKDATTTVVAEIEASPNAPSVTLLGPNGGESLASDEVVIEWSAEDLDGDSLRHIVQFSADGGASWTTLALDVVEQSFTLPREILSATSQGLIRVITSDGFHQSRDESDAVFSVVNSSPVVTILSPGDNQLAIWGETLVLQASGFDTEDGNLESSAIEWTSDINGNLGSGESLQVAASSLTEGTHVLTATATDTMAATGSDTVTVEILEDQPGLLVDIGLQLSVFVETTLVDEPHPMFLLVENAGPDPVDDLVITLNLETTPLGDIVEATGEIVVMQLPDGWSCTPVGLVATCDAPLVEAQDSAEIEFSITIDALAELLGTATFTSAAVDRQGANNTATISYRLRIPDLIFANGLEDNPQ